MTRHKLTHAECAANVAIGIAISQSVFYAMGLPLTEAVSWNAIFLGLSYGRQYVLRRVFARIEGQGSGFYNRDRTISFRQRSNAARIIALSLT